MIDSRLHCSPFSISSVDPYWKGFFFRSQTMSVLPDTWIREMSKTRRMIDPFADQRNRAGKISYGVSSYGYDFRLSREFKIPEFEDARLLDPKKMDQIRFRDYSG